MNYVTDNELERGEEVLRKRVLLGVALFEEPSEDFPDGAWPNWYQEINLDTLDISSGVFCATAQYAGSHGADQNWVRGMALLGLDEDGYAERGFNAGEDIISPEGYFTFPSGNEESEANWQLEILTNVWGSIASQRLATTSK